MRYQRMSSHAISLLMLLVAISASYAAQDVRPGIAIGEAA